MYIRAEGCYKAYVRTTVNELRKRLGEIEDESPPRNVFVPNSEDRATVLAIHPDGSSSI